MTLLLTALILAALLFAGFTRNKKLWESVPNHDSLHIGLTIDDMDEALAMSIQSGKMTCCPEFETGYAQMIFSGKVRTRCSGWWCITEKGETRNSDCTQCLAVGEGCYYRFRRIDHEASEVEG